MNLNKHLGRVYLVLIFLLALYIRIEYISIAPFEFKIDAWSMYNYALNIREGFYYGHAFGDYWARYAYWPPLYIFLTGFVYKFLGEGLGIDVLRLFQAFISALSCCMVYLITAETVRGYSRAYREGALLAGFLMCVNPRMIAYANHLYVETIFMFIYLLAVYYLLKHYKYKAASLEGRPVPRPGYRYLIAGSILLGIGNLARPVILLVPFIMTILVLLTSGPSRAGFMWTLRAALMDTAVILGIMLAVISPWTLRNYLVTGKVILIDTNGPINFYIAHNPNANGTWINVKPDSPSGHRLYETGYKEGSAYLFQNPHKEFELFKLKQLYIFTKSDFHVDEASGYIAKSLKFTFVQLPLISVTYLWLISGILLFIALSKLAAAKKAGILLKEPAWIIGNIIYFDLIILAFYFAPRYRIILEPFLICMIGVLAALIVSCKQPELG